MATRSNAALGVPHFWMCLAWLASWTSVPHALAEETPPDGAALETATAPPSPDEGGAAGDDAEEPPPPPSGAADPELDDRKARDLFEEGRKAYEEGEYRDAWDYFHQAYRLSKRPELLYNVGQSADRLRQDREALAAFRLYLKRLPEAQNRREVENRIRALEERIRQEDAENALTAGDDGDDDSAEDVAFYSDEQSEEAIAPPGAQPERTGWYLRGALGLGFLRDGLSNDGVDQTISSGTLAGLATLGYGIADDHVVGGGVFIDWALSPRVDDNDLERANLTMVGPFADYYLDPYGNGWHLMAALGLGVLSVADQSATLPQESVGGVALMAGGGYEWPIDRRWAVGALGRLTLGRLSQDYADHTLIALSVAASAAWY